MVELHDDGISDAARITNSMAYGLAEMIGEGYFTVPLIKNIFKGDAGNALKDIAASGVMGALKKTAAVSGKLGKGFVTEGSGEVVTEILQNAADLLTGAEELDYKSMSKPEILKHLVKGVPDSFLIGGTMGSGMAAASFGPGKKNSFSQADDLMAEVEVIKNAEVADFMTRDDLSDAETVELRQLLRETPEQYASRKGAETLFPQHPVDDVPDMTLEDIADFEQRKLEQRRSIGWAVEDTDAAVAEFMNAFEAAPEVVTVSSAQYLPPEILNAARDHAGDIEAALDPDRSRVYIVADKVSPEQVPAKLLHEMAGHVGLSAALGDAMNDTLLKLYSDRASDIAELVNSRGYAYDLDSQSGQLAAAEEFLAITAESGVKPSWWREMLLRIKNTLRKIPAFANMRFTDAEINAMLANSLKAVKKRRSGLPNSTITGQAGSAGRFSDLPSLSNNIKDNSNNVKFSIQPEQLRGRLDAMDTEIVSPDELHINQDLPKAKMVAEVIEQAKAKGIIGEIVNDYDGKQIIVSARAIRNSLFHSSGPVKVQTIAKLDKLLKTGIPIYQQPNETNHKLMNYVYAAKVKYEGVDYVVGLLCHEDVNGNRFYDHELSEIKELATLSSEPGRSDSAEQSPAQRAEELAALSPDAGRSAVNAALKQSPAQRAEEPTALSARPGRSDNAEQSPAQRASIMNIIRNALNVKTDNVKFSFAAISAEDMKSMGAIIAPLVKNKQISNADAVKKHFSSEKLSDADAETILNAAREQIKTHAAREKERLYQEWILNTKPLVAQVMDRFPNGIKPDPRFGEMSGSFFSKKGTPSDEAARYLNIEEQELVDSLNGLTKSSLRREYTETNSPGFAKLRLIQELDMFTIAETNELIKNIEAGTTPITREIIAEYPGIAEKVRETLNIPDGEISPSIVNIAIKQGKSKAEKRRIFAALNELRYQETVAEAPEKQLIAAQKYIVDYARKVMPDDKVGLVLKYLDKGKLTRKRLDAALDEIEKYAGESSAYKKLKGVHSQLLKTYRKLHRDFVKGSIDTFELIEDIREKIMRHLPDDVTKRELNMILSRMAKIPKASSQAKGFRRIPITDEFGNQLTDQFGEPAWKLKTDESGKISYGKDGKPLYEWERHPGAMSEKQRLAQEIFKVVDGALYRSIREELVRDINALLDKTQQKKDQRGHDVGRLTPEIQQSVDYIRKITRMKPSEVADAIAAVETERMLNKPETDYDALDLKLADYAMFANLNQKSTPQLDEAYKNLKSLVFTGRAIYQEKYQQWFRHKEINQGTMILSISGNKGLMDENTAKKTAEAREKAFGKFLIFLENVHEKNLSWEYLLDHFTRYGSRELSDQYKVLVHRATQQEKTGKAAKSKRFVAASQEIFGKSGRALNRVLSDMRTEQDKTGVIVMKGREAREISYTFEEYQKYIDDLRRTEALDPESRASIERSIAVEQKRLDDAKMNNKRRVRALTITKEGTPYEMRLSKAQAMQLYLTYQQEDLRGGMVEKHGYTDDTMKQIEKFVGRQTFELGKWVQKQLAEEYFVLNAIYQDTYHVSMPQIENYFPARFDAGKDSKENEKIGEIHGNSSISPGALISRRTHSAMPDSSADFLTVYTAHVMEMEHFKAWAAPVKELRAVFGGKDVAKVIRQYYGNTAYNVLNGMINRFADGGNRNADANPFVDMTRKGYVIAKLSYNTGVFVKQLTSLPAYAMDMPIKDFIYYVARFLKHPITNARTIIESDYVRNRWGEGYERDVSALLADVHKSTSPVAKLLEAGMFFGKLGDMIPVIMGGYAVYQYNYDKAIKSGADESTAYNEAILAFEMATDRTQQAGSIKDLGQYQAGGSMARLFTMFTTSPLQYYRNIYSGVLDAKAGKISTAEAAKKIFIGHMLLPTLFQLATDIMSKFDDWEEWSAWDYARAMTLGPLNGLFLFGTITKEAIDAAFGSYRYGNDSLVPVSSDLAKLTQGIYKVQQQFADGEMDFDEVLETADKLAEGTSAVNPVTGIYSAAKRELKRFGRMFGIIDDDKPSKNKQTNKRR
ncbi:MAG: hypothetical protein JXR78_16635, partial [Victivallales bacterium]|nr:hypothetical protein [Victivallales bacterium]